jgi:hypothetical protein
MKKIFVFAFAIALICGLTLNAQTPQNPKKEMKKEVEAKLKVKEANIEVKEANIEVKEAKTVVKDTKKDLKKAELKEAKAKKEVKNLK